MSKAVTQPLTLKDITGLKDCTIKITEEAFYNTSCGVIFEARDRRNIWFNIIERRRK